MACKEQWKTEIEEKLENLKTIERELSNKEKQLLEVRRERKYYSGAKFIIYNFRLIFSTSPHH